MGAAPAAEPGLLQGQLHADHRRHHARARHHSGRLHLAGVPARHPLCHVQELLLGECAVALRQEDLRQVGVPHDGPRGRQPHAHGDQAQQHQGARLHGRAGLHGRGAAGDDAGGAHCGALPVHVVLLPAHLHAGEVHPGFRRRSGRRGRTELSARHAAPAGPQVLRGRPAQHQLAQRAGQQPAHAVGPGARQGRQQLGHVQLRAKLPNGHATFASSGHPNKYLNEWSRLRRLGHTPL
mmetsp:Transcript_32091/g.80992  ORF Transcript_32091/g.80992 Transcript_32091/m.80992 type:complete len:237 (-) Transcript_32091:36-746(-)